MTQRVGRPLIVAHRGDRERFPENTLPAFESALAKGADTLELDVFSTRDGELGRWVKMISTAVLDR